MLSVLNASGSLGSFVLSRLTMKLKLSSGFPLAKSRPSIVTVQPAPHEAGAAIAGKALG